MIKRVSFVLACLLPALVHANGVEALQAYYRDVKSLRGEFVQTTRDEAGNAVEESSGELVIQRPDRFRWDYRQPYEQLVVADGRRLWVYDVELEQATVRPLGEALRSGPALLLSGDYASLETAFRIADEGDGWVRLTPQSDEWDFQSLRIKLENNVPRVLIVETGFGQTTELELDELETNPQVNPARFAFQPPAGVDVISASGR